MTPYRPRKGEGRVVSVYLPSTHVDALDRWAKHKGRSRSFAVAKLVEGAFVDNQAAGKVFFVEAGDRIPDRNTKEEK